MMLRNYYQKLELSASAPLGLNTTWVVVQDEVRVVGADEVYQFDAPRGGLELVPEVDGVRLVSGGSVELLRMVPTPLQAVFVTADDPGREWGLWVGSEGRV